MESEAAAGEPVGETPRGCPNCGRFLEGEYCAGCGQRQRSYRRALPRILAEFLGEMLELDGRVLKSVRLLVLRPGGLTREFFADRRASYLNPIRLYLASSLLFFFLLSMTSDLEFGVDRDAAPEAMSQLDDADRQSLRRAREQLREELSGGSTALADTLAELESLERSITDTAASSAAPEESVTGKDTTPADAESRAEDPSDFEARLEARAQSLYDDPAAASDAFIDNLPVAAFLLLPLFAMLLKLFYPRHFLVEHLIFALHLHAFLFLALGLRLLLPDADGEAGWQSLWDNLRRLLTLACLAYAGVALKVYYGQSLRRTLVKGGLLLCCYGLLLAFTLLATVVGTVLG